MAIGAVLEADDEVVCGKVNGPRMHALRRALRAMGYDEQLELTRRVWLELIRYYLHPETEVHTGRPSDRLTVDALARLIRPDYPMPEMWWYADVMKTTLRYMAGRKTTAAKTLNSCMAALSTRKSKPGMPGLFYWRAVCAPGAPEGICAPNFG